MVSTTMTKLTPERIDQLLAAYQRGRERRLLVRAVALELRVSPDQQTGGYAVRSSRRRGYVELVTDAGCTCKEYQVRSACPHTALVAAQREAEAAT